MNSGTKFTRNRSIHIFQVYKVYNRELLEILERVNGGSRNRVESGSCETSSFDLYFCGTQRRIGKILREGFQSLNLPLVTFYDNIETAIRTFLGAKDVEKFTRNG